MSSEPFFQLYCAYLFFKTFFATRVNEKKVVEWRDELLYVSSGRPDGIQGSKTLLLLYFL